MLQYIKKTFSAALDKSLGRRIMRPTLPRAVIQWAVTFHEAPWTKKFSSGGPAFIPISYSVKAVLEGGASVTKQKEMRIAQVANGCGRARAEATPHVQ